MFDPALNVALQRLQSPAVTLFFQFATALAYAPVLIAFLSMLYWTWDKRRVFGLIQLFLYSSLIENMLKEVFHTLRPFQVDPEHVQLLDYFMRREIADSGTQWAIPARTSFSFPSGHAQMAICFYGAMALHLRRREATIGAAVLIVAIALSRLYLGCHFLGDVLGGLLAGGVILSLYAMIVRLDGRRNRFPSRQLMHFLAFAAPIGLFLFWPDSSSAMRAAFLLGFAGGFFAERRWVHFSTDGPPKRRIARFAIGLTILVGAYFVLNRVLHYAAENNLFAEPIFFTIVCYGAIGLVVSLGVPGLLSLLGLATESGGTTEAKANNVGEK
jgi:membrane-associated phospholipid phosphatase